MAAMKLLVANRGEVAVRVLRAAAEYGAVTVAVHSEDDAESLHVRRADERHRLPGSGPAAYLDADALVAVALEHGCDTVHPGWGFLAESAAFATACTQAGLHFAGPTSDTLALLGDKTAARALAARCAVAVLPGSSGPVTPEEARDLLTEYGALMLKAVSGGGGRGMRAVTAAADLDAAWERAASEARAAFGDDRLYAERLLPSARHLEVQVVGDGTAVAHLWERDCTLQRRHQKIVEVAPAPGLDEPVRERLLADAVRMAEAAGLTGLATFEFLLDTGSGEPYFIEANPRLQVEHTVTEEITGVDLVKAQLRIAAGATLADLALPAATRGTAVQARVNLESVQPDGTVTPTAGTLRRFEVPSGPGVRVDTFGYGGYRTNPRFDSLLAKVVAHGCDLPEALVRVRRALGELTVEGADTNAAFLRALLGRPDVAGWRVTTAYVDQHAAELVPHSAAVLESHEPGAVAAPSPGTVVSVEVGAGDAVAVGQALVVLEAMKMEHVVAAPAAGTVRRVDVAPGDPVTEGQPLVEVEPGEVDAAGAGAVEEVDLDRIRPDLAEVRSRHEIGLDAARPEAVAKRHGRGKRTARENIAELVDPGSLIEYGALAIAAQRRRRSVEELIERTPADGLVAGIGTVNGGRAAVLSYDYMVLAGTQGMQNHRKKDRLFELAERWRLPVVFFTEGGGGRPGDTDAPGVSGLDTMAFHLFGRLSGLVPLVGVASGRCFAGNAAILGCCDVVIATADATIGMGGPAMIEGGGLGVVAPEDVGPMPVQVANGVVDVLVEDEAEAVRAARQYLSYFQGTTDGWECADQRLLRHAIPENRLRVYDVRSVIETLADTGSVLELRRGFGPGMVTALARVEGRPVGIVANNPVHLAGAIDSTAADKAARFLQLCDAHDLPVLFLCDTPGIMVGPDAERTALVRHASRLFVTGGSLTVPVMTIVLRKGYGLGAQAMAGGSFKAPLFCVAWPTGEVGGMGLEGAVRLGYRRELEAVADPAERQALFDQMVARAYEHGKALNSASHFEIDDVIDPVDSRHWVSRALASVPPPAPRDGKKRPCIDTW